MSNITIDDFKKVEIKIGRVVSAEKMPGADKLLILQVDFSEEAPRQILSGIAEYFPEPEKIIGRQFPFVTNLETRTLRGYESNGMILATSGDFGLALLSPDTEVPNGTIIK
jgi:methionine--tRNA ligase beta chain